MIIPELVLFVVIPFLVVVSFEIKVNRYLTEIEDEGYITDISKQGRRCVVEHRGI